MELMLALRWLWSAYSSSWLSKASVKCRSIWQTLPPSTFGALNGLAQSFSGLDVWPVHHQNARIDQHQGTVPGRKLDLAMSMRIPGKHSTSLENQDSLWTTELQ